MGSANRTARTAVLITLCVVASATITFGDEEIVLCDLGVTREIRNANASFSVVYQIDIDRTGNVTRASKVKNEFLPDGKVAGCLMRWKFKGPSRQATVMFQWKHAEGWISAAVTDGGTTRTIRFDPGWASFYRSPR